MPPSVLHTAGASVAGLRGTGAPCVPQPRSPNGVSASAEWTRQVNVCGKVYFFNKATGASQWHLPTELYKPRYLGRVSTTRRPDRVQMPSCAKALWGVDCMTETSLPDAAEDAGSSDESTCAQTAACEEPPPDAEPAFVGESVLVLTIVRARGLRDADFMPGADKSDPYCVVENLGGKRGAFRTHAIADELNPVWNHTGLLTEVDAGDTVEFTIWDSDSPTQDVNGTQNYSSEGAEHLFNDGDEFLGRCSIACEDLLQCRGQKEIPLEDAGEDIEAYLTVEAHMSTQWPSLFGMAPQEAMLKLQVARPELKMEVCEVPHSGCRVVSFDPLHARQGYTGNFIGVYSTSALILHPGNSILVGGRTYTVSHLGPTAANQVKQARSIRYVFLQEVIASCIKDGALWKKVTQKPTPGLDHGRVVLWFEGAFGSIARVPRTG